MKKKNVFSLASLLLVAAILTSCGGLPKMVKRAGELKYTVTPEVLEMHADSVEISISVKFPEKYFHKKVIVEATPVLKWEGGEKTFKPETVQGEGVEANNKVIPFEKGGAITYTDKIAFEDAMRVSALNVRLKGTQGSKEAVVADQKVADGVIATPSLLMYDGRATFVGDKFVRTTSESKSADIHFTINKADVRSTELKDADMKELLGFINEAKENERRQFKGVGISAYASPDGAQDLNTKLADNRATSTQKYLKNEFKKVVGADSESFYKSTSTPEDWDGFKKLMQESDLEDKELIVKVLGMYTDPDVREKEIKKIAKVYLKVADKVLPKLRRSKLSIDVDVVGYSDEEITAMANSTPDSLKVEELLYAGSLTTNLDQKLKIYQDFARVYKNDWRGPNDIGWVYLKSDKVAEAKANFEAAKALENGNAIIMNNLGATALREGQVDKALELLESAAGAGKELSYNLGIISIKKAGIKSAGIDYTEAVTYFGSDCSFNAALALILAGKAQEAGKAIDCAENKDDAMMYYLKAIVGARMSDTEIMFNNLRTAIEKDGSISAIAKKDMEFGKYFQDDTFKSIVGG